MVWQLVCSRICQLVPSLERLSRRNAYAFPKHLPHQDPFACARDLDASTPLHANRACIDALGSQRQSSLLAADADRFLEDDGPSIDLRHQLMQRYPVLLFALID